MLFFAFPLCFLPSVWLFSFIHSGPFHLGDIAAIIIIQMQTTRQFRRICCQDDNDDDIDDTFSKAYSNKMNERMKVSGFFFYDQQTYLGIHFQMALLLEYKVYQGLKVLLLVFFFCGSFSCLLSPFTFIHAITREDRLKR